MLQMSMTLIFGFAMIYQQDLSQSNLFIVISCIKKFLAIKFELLWLIQWLEFVQNFFKMQEDQQIMTLWKEKTSSLKRIKPSKNTLTNIMSLFWF